MPALDFNLTNKSNYKERGDYGIRVARPGFDAENCAQNQLLFNSNWPILQICKVIDLDKVSEYSHKYFDVSGDRWIDSLPSGLSTGGFVSITGARVSKNYLFYSGGWRRYYDSSYNTYYDFYYKKYYHGIGYPPFYFLSSEVSGVNNKVVLTSVDISKDVDYPYTEGPLPIISPNKDYGISSSSVFGDRVPGLCSNMFSKLVQCVKTTETSRWSIGQGDDLEKKLCWSPFKSAEEFKAGVLNKYEAFVFSGYNCPFLDASSGGFAWDNPNLNTDLFGDAPYYSRDEVVGMMPISTTSSLYGDAAAYCNVGQDNYLYNDASLVVLRSPMVSPEYEEVAI